MQCGKLTLISIGLGHDLDFGTITLKINENEFGTGGTDRHDTSSHCDYLILNEDFFGQDLLIIPSKFVDAVSASKLVRIWINVLITKSLDKILSVLRVLRWVFLLLSEVDLGLLTSSFLCSVFSCLFSSLFGFFFFFIAIILALLLALIQLAELKKKDISSLDYLLIDDILSQNNDILGRIFDILDGNLTNDKFSDYKNDTTDQKNDVTVVNSNNGLLHYDDVTENSKIILDIVDDVNNEKILTKLSFIIT